MAGEIMRHISAVAFIPARKASKRLKGKNKKKLDGMPLFQYTVMAAINSKCYEEVILTSDDTDILEIGNKINGLTVIERPNAYATDEVKTMDVVYYHLKELSLKQEYVSLLLPTSPFRDAWDIAKSFELLLQHNAETIVSVTEYEFNPSLALKIEKLKLKSYFGNKFVWERESAFETAYHFNGSIFTTRMKTFMSSKTFYHDGATPYVMTPIKSVDIDNELDFKYAEFIIKEKLIKINNFPDKIE